MKNKKFNVASVVKDSIVDGTGLRTTIFFQGCPHSCEGCHNPSSWDMDKIINEYTIDELITIIEEDNLTKNVTLSGGEPFLQNHKLLLELMVRLKEKKYNIWIFTGYTIDDLKEKDGFSLLITKLADVIVDGKYEKDLKDISTSFRGSSNQQIIKKI